LFFKIDGSHLHLPENEETRERIQFFWRDQNNLADINLQPEFLTTALNDISDSTKHIVNFGKGFNS
jgi:hypothetical protein